jgi:hypothetical protein
MKEDLIYDEWIPYTDYEKGECDVKLKDGTIVYHCWPNAGKFNPLCSDMDEVLEEDIVEIMYRKYYVQDLCKGCCNGGEPRSEIDFIENEPDEYSQAMIDKYIDINEHLLWSNFPMREHTPPFVRAEPKIGRNETCPCGSGKKYKKCCI